MRDIESNDSGVDSAKTRNNKKQESRQKIRSTKMDNLIKQWHSEIELLTYEQTIEALDLLLEDLQKDTVAIDDLQRYYLKGNIYLSHCERLLDKVEQEVLEIDYEVLDKNKEI